MTVKELVLQKMCELYEDQMHCKPSQKILTAYEIGAIIADVTYGIGYRKGLSDAQIGGGYVRYKIAWKGA